MAEVGSPQARVKTGNTGTIVEIQIDRGHGNRNTCGGMFRFAKELST